VSTDSTATSVSLNPDSGVSPRPQQSGVAIAIIVICQFMVGLDATVVNIALPEIHRALHFSSTSLAWVTSAYTLAFAGLLLLGGRAGDILGRRKMFITGLVLFGAASLVGGLANSEGLLLTMRAVQGVGAALAAPNSLALISTNVAEEQRPKAYAAVAGSYAASLALGLIAGGMLTQWASWRWVMFIAVPMAVVVLLLAPKFLVEPAPVPGKFDLGGAALSVAFMSALVYGLIHSATDGWSNAATAGPLAAAAVLLVGFLAVESRASQPIMPLGLFRNRNVAASYFDLMALTAVMAGTNFFATQLLQDVLGYSPIKAGLAFLPMAFGIFMGGGVASKLITQLPSRNLVVVGALFILGGMVWLSQVDLGTSYAGGIVGPLIMFGVGAGTAFTALNAIILGNASEQYAGAASSVLEVMQWVGFSLGVGVLITFFGHGSRHAASHLPSSVRHQDIASYVEVHGIGTAFTASLAFAGLALLAAFVLRTPKPDPAAAAAATGGHAAEEGAAAPH
jgi:EmrB/QacA subfamily drug resistance transporter